MSLESGELRYVDERRASSTNATARRSTSPKVRVQDAVLASASIPVMFPPTELGGEYYVDGGVREILPLALAFNQLGAGHIFAVVASKPGVERVARRRATGACSSSPGGSRPTSPPTRRCARRSDPPRGWGRRVTVIVPEVDVHDALTIDPELIAASIDYGYMRAADVLLEPRRGAAELSAEIARTRMRLRAARGPGARVCSRPSCPTWARVPRRRRRRARARCCELVERRHASGAPMPPGPCGTDDRLIRLGTLRQSELASGCASTARGQLRSACAADEVAGAGAGVLAVLDSVTCAGDDGRDVAVGALHEAAGVAGQVVHHLAARGAASPSWSMTLTSPSMPGRERAAVAEAVERRGLARSSCCTTHSSGSRSWSRSRAQCVSMNVGVLASHVVPQCAPPSPRPHALVGCSEHLAHRVEVDVGVVEQRPHHERAAVVAPAAAS